MAKKVTDILKELGISFEELQNTASRLGVEVKSNRGSMSDVDAGRVIDTISKLKGLPTASDTNVGAPKPKAVPLIKKPMPAGKPIIPKTFADKEKNVEEQAEPEQQGAAKKVAKPATKQAPAEEKVVEPIEKSEPAEVTPVAAEEKQELTVDKSASAGEKPAVVPTEATEKTEATSDEKASKGKQPKTKATKEKPKEIPEAPVAQDYENAPDKPMRFKKIFDASEAPKEEPKREPKPKKAKAENKGKGDGKDSRKDTRKDGAKDKSREKQKDKSDSGDRKPAKSQSRPAKPAAGEDVPAKPSKGKSKKFFDNKDKGKDREKGESRKKFEKRESGGAKNTRYYDEHSLEKQTRTKRKNKPKPVESVIEFEELLPAGTVAVTTPITVAGLSEQAEISASKLIMSLMKLGVMATINQTLDKDTVELLAADLGLQIAVMEEHEEIDEPGLDLHEDAESELKDRAPIITVMGHVDHGKTSLLDAIRDTNVTAGESGGITQHIGASEVVINGKKIVFLDTPGHEAFTTMRARGAQVTDIAVLVVAADDSVKPQTLESISHAKAAGVPIIVAINKMDKPGANPDKVKSDLADHGVLVEDWGGDVICVPVSAKKGEGITSLLEMILLQAEVLELKANPDRLALGTVIEARLDKTKGPIATLLVTNGTLKTGQSVVAGTCAGKIRVMTNYKGEAIRKALPATPVEILGLSDVPMAGDAFNAVKDDKLAREIAANRKERMREEVMAKNASMTLDRLFSQIQEGEVKELNLIVKADVQGSVGAIISSLEKLDNENVKVRVIHSGVGTVSESDVRLAETSNAIIIGFNVRPTTAVMTQAQDADVEIRLYRVIYDIIDDIQDAMKGMLDPEFKEESLGIAEVRDTFKVPGIGTVAGAYVTEGKLQRNAQIRLIRDGIVIHEGTISSLKRFKDDVKEVATSYECGIGIENYNDIKPGDEIECFTMVEVER